MFESLVSYHKFDHAKGVRAKVCKGVRWAKRRRGPGTSGLENERTHTRLCGMAWNTIVEHNDLWNRALEAIVKHNAVCIRSLKSIVKHSELWTRTLKVL